MSVAILEDAIGASSDTLQLQVNGQSRRAYQGDVLVFRGWLDAHHIEPSQIDYEVAVRYHAHLLDTYSKSTAARRFVVARRVLEVAAKRGVVHVSVYDAFRDYKSKITLDDSSPHTALSKQEAKKLLGVIDTATAIGKRDYAMLSLLIFAGVRRAECAAIRIGDITSKQEHTVLTVQHGKGNKRRDIPLRPEVFRAIKVYLDAVGRLDDSPESHLFTGFRKGQHSTNVGLTDRQICNIVKGYAAQAQLQCTPHDLRASAITFWIDTGSPLVLAQHHAGHASPITTERYYSRKQELDNSPVYRVNLDE